jgi:hypothetical protein
MRKEMSKPTFFQMFVPGDSNANPHVFFPLFYKVVRINLLGGNHPHFIASVAFLQLRILFLHMEDRKNINVIRSEILLWMDCAHTINYI